MLVFMRAIPFLRKGPGCARALGCPRPSSYKDPIVILEEQEYCTWSGPRGDGWSPVAILPASLRFFSRRFLHFKSSFFFPPVVIRAA